MSKLFKSARDTLFGKTSKESSQSTSQSTAFNTSQSTNGSTSASLGYNQAYPMLSGALSPQVNTGTQASGSLAALLGLGGDAKAQSDAFARWRGSTGYQFGLDQGVGAITGSQAAKGLLNSGSTLKSLAKFGTDYANTQYEKYLNPLMSLITSGNQAGSVISGAGGLNQSASQSYGQSTADGGSQSTSQSTGSGTGGKEGLIGQLLSAGAKAATAGAGG